VHQLTWQSLIKAGLPPTAVNLLAKMNDYQTRQALTLLIITSGKLCLNTARHFIRSQSWTEESLAVTMGPFAAGLN